MFDLMRTIGFAAALAVRVHGDAKVVRYLDPRREPVRRLLATDGPHALSSLQTRQATVMAFVDAWRRLAIALCAALFLSLLLKPARITRVPG